MSFILLYLAIWTVVVLIAASLVVVLARRMYMTRKYRRLDSERERFAPLLTHLSAGRHVEDTEPYSHKPGSPAWTAVEEVLFRVLNSETGRDEAARLFESLGYARHYIRKLKNGNRWERALAAEKLGEIRYTAAVPHLLEAMGSRRRDLKLMAVNALGAIRDEGAIPHLITMLKHTLAREEEVSVRVLKSAIISFGPAVLRELLLELKNPDWRVRAAMLDIIGEIGDRGAAPELTRMLSDPEHEVRAKAAKGLGKLRHRDAVPELIRGLNDEDWVTRLHSARALGLIGDGSALMPLKDSVCDRNWQVRAAASESLLRLGKKGYVELLNIFLDIPDKYAKDQALDDLCRAGVYKNLVSMLEGRPRPLDPEQGAEDRNEIREDCLLEMAGILSTLSQWRLENELYALSGGASGVRDEGVEKARDMILALRGRPAGEAGALSR
ncbi:MAG: HEAT repeat domain-containing protein [Candidatus Methylomirabilis sp.]|nr:HEAT repeat domain-containing protein [Deltaproteobacteria bacterium]